MFVGTVGSQLVTQSSKKRDLWKRLIRNSTKYNQTVDILFSTQKLREILVQGTNVQIIC